MFESEANPTEIYARETFASFSMQIHYVKIHHCDLFGAEEAALYSSAALRSQRKFKFDRLIFNLPITNT